MGHHVTKFIARTSAHSEKGQAIVLIGFALVAMLGITALAIDGGRLLADRRKAQNTADTASFAGALLIAQVDSGDPSDILHDNETLKDLAIAKAFERAASNGYNDYDPDVDVTVAVSDALFDEGIYYYTVTVEITSRIDGALTPLIYSGQLTNTVYSIAMVKPIQGIAWGNSLYATAPDECNAILFSGTGDVTITDGGIYSNSNSGDSNCPSIHRRGNSNIYVDKGDIKTAGKYKNSGASGSIHPLPREDEPRDPFDRLPAADCTDMDDHGKVKINPGTSIVLHPGIYNGLSISGTDANPTYVTLAGGLYCIHGSGFSTTGGIIFADGVFFYMADGDFSISANSNTFLFAPQSLYDESGYFWGGMLIYMPDSNGGTITISGNSSSVFSGTIFAPDPASPASRTRCKIVGTGETLTISSQIICYSIEITGDGDITMTYDANASFKLGSSMSLME